MTSKGSGLESVMRIGILYKFFKIKDLKCCVCMCVWGGGGGVK